MNNQKLEIVKLDNKKFPIPVGYAMLKGYGFKHPELGHLSFGPGKDGYILPYNPKGGRKALQQIINNGGFVTFDDMYWVEEVNDEHT